MILKVDGITTEQYYQVVEWIAGDKNQVTLDEARKMAFHGDKTVIEVTRTRFSRNAKMGKGLEGVIRTISVKAKLTDGTTRDESDSYDIVLEIPQYMFLQLEYGAGTTAPPSSCGFNPHAHHGRCHEDSGR